MVPGTHPETSTRNKTLWRSNGWSYKRIALNRALLFVLFRSVYYHTDNVTFCQSHGVDKYCPFVAYLCAQLLSCFIPIVQLFLHSRYKPKRQTVFLAFRALFRLYAGDISPAGGIGFGA